MNSKVTKDEIDEILSEYDLQKITTGHLCSHSTLQNAYGSRQEGLRTLGFCTPDRCKVYKSFPLASPDTLLQVKNFKDILEPKWQKVMRKANVIMIPTGSVVEYVGPENLEKKFYVPLFGNRRTLEWERDRKKQRQWLEKANLKMPREYSDPSEIDGKVFVKLSGAKGGRGFFTASSEKEYYSKLNEGIRRGVINKNEPKTTIQEFISGVRYYVHYFYSSFETFEEEGANVGEGRVELLSMDRRIEPIDESYRGLPVVPEEFVDYTVTGNEPLVIRESLLRHLIKYGVDTVNTSLELFSPGIQGPFCLETIYHPDIGFTVFEVSARIVAGTNLYPHGSPYSWYIFSEPMSTGRRIAREIKRGREEKQLNKIIF